MSGLGSTYGRNLSRRHADAVLEVKEDGPPHHDTVPVPCDDDRISVAIAAGSPSGPALRLALTACAAFGPPLAPTLRSALMAFAAETSQFISMFGTAVRERREDHPGPRQVALAACATRRERMVQIVRLRSRLLNRSLRLSRSRSQVAQTMGVRPIRRRYPQAETLYRAPRVDRQRTGHRRVGELLRRPGTDERYVVEQLRQLAEIFPGSRVIKE